MGFCARSLPKIRLTPMSDTGVTPPRATRRPLLQAAYVDNLRRRPNRVTEHNGDICIACEAKGIITPLSRFNKSPDYCFAHTPMEPVMLNAKHARGAYVICRHCTQTVPRSEFIARRGRCRDCDQKAA